jgi:hypoxanthine phosphoribosyltransferase
LNSSKREELGVKEFELLYRQDQIEKRIQELADQLTAVYHDKNPVLVGVLKGCLIFMADLIRRMPIAMELEFINVSYYNGRKKREEKMTMAEKPKIPLKGRHVLLVEGVVDSGKTARDTIDLISKQEPASIEVVTLLNKSKCRTVAVDIKYMGFEAEDYFVIGYGLDKEQKYRNLPFIGRVLNEG